MTTGEDTHAILNLLYRYAEMLDEGDFTGVATMFNEDIIVGGTVTGRGSDHVETCCTRWCSFTTTTHPAPVT